MSNQLASTNAALDALGEPVRRAIVEALRSGPLPVGTLADRLPVGRPAVSKHLRVLGEAGLVTYRSSGTRNLYALAPDGLTAVQAWLGSLWDAALSSYADAVHAVHGTDTDTTDTTDTEIEDPP